MALLSSCLVVLVVVAGTAAARSRRAATTTRTGTRIAAVTGRAGLLAKAPDGCEAAASPCGAQQRAPVTD
uniref:Putative secreted protein n=1 Tax=Ixodes ricinus TaxID=34613 RepID=A0A6B0TZZ0_IXORI